MGCVNASTNGEKQASAAGVKQQGGEGQHDQQQTSWVYSRTVVPHEVILPDPDLGWRRLDENANWDESNLPEPVEDEDEVVYGELHPPSKGGAPSGTAGQTPGNAAGDAAILIMPDMPEVWMMQFFNVRTWRFSHPILPVLALNVGIRANSLAVGFGVVAGGPQGIRVHDAAFMSDAAEAMPPAEGDFDAIYKAIGVPNYQWQLLEREWLLSTWAKQKNKKTTDSGGGLLCSGWKRRSAGERKQSHNLSVPQNDADGGEEQKGIFQEPLQKMKNRSGNAVLTDCGSIGMNIAEQLYRLERADGTLSKSPNDIFGWKILSATSASRIPGGPSSIVVCSPEQEAFLIVPEELVMNVASWVQDTYLTQSAF